MGDGTPRNPYTRKDVCRLIEEHGGTAEGLDLSGKYFEAGIDFSGEYDEERINLSGAILNRAMLKRAVFEKCHLDKASLIGAHLEGAKLRAAHLEGAYLGNAHVEGADFSLTLLKGASLAGVEFSRDTKLERADWGKKYVLGDEEREKDFDTAEDIYCRLKTWYTEHGRYGKAARFYYREKEAKRKGSKKFYYRLIQEFLKHSFGYGEHWWRVLIWTAVVILVFAIAYYIWGGLSISDSIYFSVVSFTALGYGSWTYKNPEDWVRVAGAAESFIGVLMMALILVTFIRKWTR